MADAEAMTSQPMQLIPEWEPHAALWVGWPHLPEEWGEAFQPAREELAAFVRTAQRYVPIRIACGSDEARGSVQQALGDLEGRVSLHRLPTGDIWLRDTGPIFGRIRDQLVARDFAFNGWGGKYVMPGDTETAQAIAEVENIPCKTVPYILEGGGIDADGNGRLLTTEACLLNANRNGWTRADAERHLSRQFVLSRIVWLADGLLYDHTDGHIDNAARFVGPGRVICQTPSGSDDPQTEALTLIEAELKDADLDVITVPSPGRIVSESGDVLPASHMNFVITNGAVLLPVYESHYAEQAMQVLQTVFPDRDIIGLPAHAILSGGGSFHCMTCHVPRWDRSAEETAT